MPNPIRAILESIDHNEVTCYGDGITLDEALLSIAEEIEKLKKDMTDEPWQQENYREMRGFNDGISCAVKLIRGE